MCAALQNDLTMGLATLSLVEDEPAISTELRHFVGAARDRLFAAAHRLEALQDGD